MKLAILDSGIDRMHPYLKDNVLGGCSVIGEKTDYGDDKGHGTLCASVIKKEAPHVRIWAVKVLNENNEATLEKLKAALEALKRTPVRLIYMSLSVTEKCDVREISRLLREMAEDGRIFVCSLMNGRRESFPAVLREVIGVRGSILESEDTFWYDSDREVQCVMDFNPYLHACPGGYRLFGKNNSFAAAKLTGRIAALLEADPQLTKEGLERKLAGLAKRTRWEEKDLAASLRFPEKTKRPVPENIRKRTEDAVKEFLEIPRTESLEGKILFWKSVGLTDRNCFALIQRLEENFGFRAGDYTDISRYDLCFIENLAAVITRMMEDEWK